MTTKSHKPHAAMDAELKQMYAPWHPSRPLANPPFKDYNLGLSFPWFACSRIDFPPPSMNLKRGTYNTKCDVSTQIRGSTLDITFIAVLWVSETLMKTQFRITWNTSNPTKTVKAQQRHGAPKMLNKKELQMYRDRYSEKLARWAESKKGTVVGDGECWTLASHGLGAIGAFPSPGFWHGYLLFTFDRTKGEFAGGMQERGVARGDLIQLFHVKLKNAEGATKTAEPGHTSIIVGVDYKEGILKVLEQNASPDRKVQDGAYRLKDMQRGELRIFRAVSKGWAGSELDLKW